MKAAPVHAALAKLTGWRQTLVHTGQHYDTNMSAIFFSQLRLPEPDVNLAVGSGTHAEQTAQIMMRFDRVVDERKPTLVMVYGDVNSTVAAALVCAKVGVPVAHVEAGLRSGDRRMPEEVNRLVTDQLSDLLFTPSADGDQNLLREGIAAEKIHRVGNVMIDSLVRCLDVCQPPPGLELPEKYVLVTLHRPSNVDNPAGLARILEVLRSLSDEVAVVLPAHPRVRARMDRVPGWDGERRSGKLLVIEPLGYLEFLHLQRRATAVVTDSGGVQEETTYLGVPCITMRENTERPVTVTVGTNVLVGTDPARMLSEVRQVLAGSPKRGGVPELWDGHASQRIADVLRRQLGQ